MGDMQKLIALLEEIDEDVDFANETAMVDEGLIDSLTISAIILAIEDTFGVHIATGEIEPENFNSVGAMLGLIDRHRQSS